MSSQDHKTDDDDESQDEDLKKSKGVHQVDSDLGRERVYQGNKNNHRNSNATLLPFIDCSICCGDNIRGKHDAAGS